MEYMEARQRYATAKAEQRRLQLEALQIKERNKPILDFEKQALRFFVRVTSIPVLAPVTGNSRTTRSV